MPDLIFGPKATKDLRRLEQFIASKDRDAAARMVETLLAHLDRLTRSPKSGSPFGEFRRMIIPFGASTYVAYYLFDEVADVVHIARLQHGLEDLNHPDHGKY